MVQDRKAESTDKGKKSFSLLSISLPEGGGAIRGIGEKFAANQARLLIGVLLYNLLPVLRQFYLVGEAVKRSMEWLIKRLIEVGAKVAYHGWRLQVHVA